MKMSRTTVPDVRKIFKPSLKRNLILNSLFFVFGFIGMIFFLFSKELSLFFVFMSFSILIISKRKIKCPHCSWPIIKAKRSITIDNIVIPKNCIQCGALLKD